MKSFFSRFLLPTSYFLLAVFLTGCFEDEVKFKGKVLEGYVVFNSSGEATDMYGINGPLPGAIVRCVGYPETATTDTGGLYELSIEVSRVIGYKAKADNYTLQAFSQRTYNNPSLDLGTDESISQYVDARPGDTIPVRDFVLMSHTDEKEQGGLQE